MTIKFHELLCQFLTVELPAEPSPSSSGTVGAVVGVLAVIIILAVVGVIFGFVGYSLLKKKRKRMIQYCSQECIATKGSGAYRRTILAMSICI